uniref:Uncharacterized protein n=1 Tax=Euplotes harpa TaxID=151035 RepID=A0A7S3JD28_9SPIT|mmetsp:Transcript_28946/g.33049  ORF Transcript_28946/g.33049 Transcript_28946/m.33049 type:complete len:149 (+) Transcript_28946:1321-1767(+)
MTQSLTLKITYQLKNESLKREMLTSMRFYSEISSTRSLKELVTILNSSLPEYLGFKSTGILIKDKTTNDMFTIPIYKDDASGNVITSIIKFPQNMGISGLVFNSSEIYVCNNASQDRKFSNDIDNLSSLQDLRNFIIFPIFSDLKGEK